MFKVGDRVRTTEGSLTFTIVDGRNDDIISTIAYGTSPYYTWEIYTKELSLVNTSSPQLDKAPQTKEFSDRCPQCSSPGYFVSLGFVCKAHGSF